MKEIELLFKKARKIYVLIKINKMDVTYVNKKITDIILVR